MLVIEWRGYDRILYGLFVHDSCASDLALHFVNSDCVQIEYLKVCDTYFAIQFDNLEEILNETDFLKEVQSVLLSTTFGVLYCVWDRSVASDAAARQA